MKTQTIKITDLHQDPANVRTHGKRNLAAIKASLARFGQQKPIVIDRSNVVRAGNGTLQAAIELGWDEIECVQSELAGSDLAAFAIADNRTAELAEWGDDLGEMLQQLVDDGVDLGDIGFSDREMRKLLSAGDSDAKDAETKTSVRELAKKWGTATGQIWALGDHLLMCGDCGDAGDVGDCSTGALTSGFV